jgi:hypothetical protein
MSKKQVLALRFVERESKEEVTRKATTTEIESRCAQGIRNYAKLCEIFPWLSEENESFL